MTVLLVMAETWCSRQLRLFVRADGNYLFSDQEVSLCMRQDKLQWQLQDLRNASGLECDQMKGASYRQVGLRLRLSSNQWAPKAG